MDISARTEEIITSYLKITNSAPQSISVENYLSFRGAATSEILRGLSDSQSAERTPVVTQAVREVNEPSIIPFKEKAASVPKEPPKKAPTPIKTEEKKETEEPPLSKEEEELRLFMALKD